MSRESKDPGAWRRDLPDHLNIIARAHSAWRSSMSGASQRLAVPGGCSGGAADHACPAAGDGSGWLCRGRPPMRCFGRLARNHIRMRMGKGKEHSTIIKSQRGRVFGCSRVGRRRACCPNRDRRSRPVAGKAKPVDRAERLAGCVSGRACRFGSGGHRRFGPCGE